ncbi:hypothetical protein [Mycoplasmopsis pullorum]|uniref:Uncharacterized protein n=1 Tax=Mycoplasmopsis pullorum TaxID=48003 RepID=A0A1L4FRB4_9BACT|nr:hypothetical protein [Mycoplasmopsis pullorum]APJ38150.1 hypothetical protein BLA55_00370 [Mycoplasmopsis pullorum]
MNYTTKKYLINTLFLSLSIIICVILLMLFEKFWVQDELKKWKTAIDAKAVYHWTSFPKHFLYYQEQMIFIIDYRVYNIITTFFVISAISIYTFRIILLFVYWKKELLKNWIKFIFLLFPFFEVFFLLNKNSIENINLIPFKKTKNKIKIILIIAFIIVSVMTIIILSINSYNDRYHPNISLKEYYWIYGSKSLNSKELKLNDSEKVVLIKTNIAIMQYSLSLIWWSIFYICILTSIKTQFVIFNKNKLKS